MLGVVQEFDNHVGLGKIKSENGESYSFHCVNIADGTRKITVGEIVEFETYTHPIGGIQACEIAIKS